MAADYDGGRLSELSHEQLQQLHEQVLENWTQSGDDRSQFNVLHKLGVRSALVAVYVVIILVGIFGNGLVVAVAASRVPRSPPASRSSLQVNEQQNKPTHSLQPRDVASNTVETVGITQKQSSIFSRSRLILFTRT